MKKSRSCPIRSASFFMRYESIKVFDFENCPAPAPSPSRSQAYPVAAPWNSKPKPPPEEGKKRLLAGCVLV